MAKHNKSTKPGSRKPTAKQKKLIALLPKVEAGEMTMQDAMLKAGYAETSAREQSAVLGSLGNNEAMQAALRKAGFTEDFLATGIVEGAQATGVSITGRLHPDFRARGIFFKLGAELLNTFPAKRVQTEMVTPQTYGDLTKKAAKSAEEARRLAEEQADEEDDAED